MNATPSHAEPILPATRSGVVPARAERSAEAAPGPFYVTDQCIICALPPETAPANIRFYFTPGCEDCPKHCYVHKQPETIEELHLAIEAACHSCVEAVRYCGTDPYVLQRFSEAGYARLCDALQLPTPGNAEPCAAANRLRGHGTCDRPPPPFHPPAGAAPAPPVAELGVVRRFLASPVNPVLLAALFLMLLGAAARPDGYPFDPDSQRVSRPSLRLKLTPQQTQEISATGTLTFSDEHLRFIRLHYPAATNRTDVVTATFNDNNEGLAPEDVYCFWVAPDEVAITLNETHPKDKSPFDPPTNNTFPTDAQLKEVASRHIRLSPDGVIYFRGRVITLEQAFAIIDDIARYPKPEREDASDYRCLYVVVPPPLAGRELFTQPDERRTPTQIFDALAVYGASKSIQVGREW